MKDNLLALVQKNSKDRTENEDWNVLRVCLRFRSKDDPTAVLQQKSGNVGYVQEKASSGNLPSRADHVGIRQYLGHVPMANRDLRNVVLLSLDQPRQMDIARDRKPANTVGMHVPPALVLNAPRTVRLSGAAR